jgi:D-serine deaminase-like pyridoxal phosphate-dependent protein
MKIIEPTVLLNAKTCQDNIQKIATKARQNGLHFRPHFKTHQSAEISEWFRDVGVTRIAVSSLTMAEYFVDGGWKDITVAFPVNVLEIEKVNRLASQISLNLLIVDEWVLDELSKRLTSEVGIFIKIDVGTRRTGISPNEEEHLETIFEKINHSNLFNFKGFLAHAGHTYSARSHSEIQKIHEDSIDILRKLKAKYESQYPGLEISTGDTPSCSVAEGWEGVDEIRPGNFVFYDVMQTQIGSCELKDIAVALACPIVAKHGDRNEIIVYGGGIHLSKDRMTTREGQTHFGLPVLLKKDGWELPFDETFVKGISQEHGVIKCGDAFFEKVKVGDVIGVLPVHSCMTVDLFDHYLDFENKKMTKFVYGKSRN